MRFLPLLTQEWRNDDVPVSTHSNEAAKLYDASITQFIGWYDDQSMGGLDRTIERMLQADHKFGKFEVSVKQF